MKLLKWLAFLPLHIGIFFARYPLSPVAVLLFSTKDKRYLTAMRWLETLDNDLGGNDDEGWLTKHIKPGSDPYSFWNRTRWLWRNGGNAVNYQFLGCDYSDPTWSGLPDKCDFRGLYVRKDGYWLFRKVIAGVEVFWGWNIYSNINGRCKFTFTTRKYHA